MLPHHTLALHTGPMQLLSGPAAWPGNQHTTTPGMSGRRTICAARILNTTSHVRSMMYTSTPAHLKPTCTIVDSASGSVPSPSTSTPQQSPTCMFMSLGLPASGGFTVSFKRQVKPLKKWPAASSKTSRTNESAAQEHVSSSATLHSTPAP